MAACLAGARWRGRRQKKHFASGAQGTAEVWDECRFAEYPTTGRDADHVAIVINSRQVGGAFFGNCPAISVVRPPKGGRLGLPWRQDALDRLGQEVWTGPCANEFDALGAYAFDSRPAIGTAAKLGSP